MRYEEASDRPGRMRRVAGVVLAVAAIGVLVLAVVDPGQPDRSAPPSATSTPGEPAGASSPAGPEVVVAPSLDPSATAQSWLIAYRTIRYDDPTPTSWTERVAPLLTETARVQLAQQVATGTTGASWERFTDARCRTRVDGVGSVVPPEAPATAETVYVQVTGVVVTSCETGAVGPWPDEPVSATLELRRAPGQDMWQVARRLF